MNNSEISYKLKYILHELGMNKTEFLAACRKFSPSISKPTILNAINGKNTIAPTIETLSTIIKVCKTSGNKKLENISYDFLLNDNIEEVEASNSAIYESIGLSDEVIARLKQFNHPLYFDYGNIINYFLVHTSGKYWQTLEMLKITCDIKSCLNKIKDNNKDKILKEILKHFDRDIYLEYLERNFRNIYDLYLNIKNTKELNQIKKEKLQELLTILENNFKYILMEMNCQFYEGMN